MEHAGIQSEAFNFVFCQVIFHGLLGPLKCTDSTQIKSRIPPLKLEFREARDLFELASWRSLVN